MNTPSIEESQAWGRLGTAQPPPPPRPSIGDRGGNKKQLRRGGGGGEAGYEFEVNIKKRLGFVGFNRSHSDRPVDWVYDLGFLGFGGCAKV